ncbi:cyclosome subunit-like protein [Leptomonas pyrrhocoris]|uniref:Cyclosome subunit-like protein n=1 Tax=Leptomonas pyrrhocoris TaxID=157538 RepID=A0A0M9G694_LEPPY|nr:cyclosome subunit-like protein [Leptomonas pyrrhocoris]KPA83237.1 cyclosome subunit-like protein [Leptomonas pyrrhocoris]|eukprot:XP_015661676.1 cyclosome subunit-like protein [Leptomonas pyrrhocoris]
MALSPYTIDVGPCQPDGTREIFLQHHQHACFSTTHREVLRVCLAKWPAKPSVEDAAHTLDLDETEALRAQRTEEAYQALLESGNSEGSSFIPSLADAPGNTTSFAHHKGSRASTEKEETPALEDYLCVFHREELADQYGRYTFVQPQTICTAYRVKDTTALELVLHGIAPRDISAFSVGSGGVFLHGRRQSSKGEVGLGASLEFQGQLYKPAADTWWMGSPLSVKPVYVAVSAVAPPGATTTTAAEGDGTSGRFYVPEPFCGRNDGQSSNVAISSAEVCVAASPIGFGADSDRPVSPHSSPRPGSPLADASVAHVEGRTAQGQFDFPRSPSSTPIPSSPLPGVSRRGEVQSGAPSSLPSSSRVPPAQAATTNPKSKFVFLDATVLTQLPLYDPQNETPLQSCLAVVRTASDELGLVLTTPLYANDAMLWQWWPHRVRLSRLASSGSALSVVASAHPSCARCLLFLYDSHSHRLRVLRTPDLHTSEGELEVLFSFPCGDLPFVFPCLHTATHPAPIAVCNYPRANWISVYDVASLLEKPSADTVAMQLDFGAHQSSHPQRFGEVRLIGDANTLPKRSGDACGSDAQHGGAAGPYEKWRRRERNSKVWGTDTATAVPHPIRSLLYHYDACLVLQYDWPSGAAQTTEAAATDAFPSTHTENAGGAAAEGGRSRRRRRCEGTISYTISFPSLTSEVQPLLAFMLEALSAAMGPRMVAFLEYQLFMEAWGCSCTSNSSSNPFQTCAAFLKRLCMPVVQRNTFAAGEEGVAGTRDHGDAASSSATAAATDPVGRKILADSDRFVDPSMLTLQRVQSVLVSSDKDATLRTGDISNTEAQSSGNAALIPSWTPQQAGLTLVALHLLFESCRLQEPLWKVLPPLAELNHSLSVQLKWPSYVEFYNAMLFTASANLHEPREEATGASCFAQCLPQEVLERHFEYLQPQADVNPTGAFSSTSPSHAPLVARSGPVEFAHGDAPDLFRLLSMLAMGSKDAASHAAMYRAWPLLRNVPETHPIALANRLVAVYRDVFGAAPVPHHNNSTRGSAPLAGSGGAEHKNSGPCRRRWWERICTQLLQQKISASLVRQVLNTGVAYPLLEAIAKGREQAEATWPAVLLDLVGRRDRCPPTSLAARLISAGRHVVEAAEENAVARQIRVALAEDDGVSVRPDFRKTWRDSRLEVAQNIFNTVTPISLSGFEDRPEELTGALELLSSRARAMPLGRGMLTMCTQSFKVQDSIPIPPLNLNGRTNDGVCMVNKSTDDLMWPLFHNGCAAGLRFLPLPPSFCAGVSNGASADAASPVAQGGGGGARGEDASSTFNQDARATGATAAQTITKQWVMYQTKNIGNAASRAGLLLATGILGHLTVLQRTDIFYLLISRQEQYVWREATTMAVMLGLSCSFCGTSSEAVFRCLSVHAQSLNPSAEDIEVSLDVQTAALVSMGLLCQQAPSNTFLVEVFLIEISRLPTDEHCSKREGYVLGAGFGLGQLLLGVGAAHGVPHVEDRLLAFMNGAPRKSAVSTREGVEYFEETMGRGEAGHFLARALLSQEQREATFNSCASVYEGDCYNVFVSGPAAAVALGLMYLQTNSAFIAAKMAPPNRRTAVQRLTPLMCHLRSTMASLICWSSIAPSRAWLFAQLPSSLLQLTTAATNVPSLVAQQRNYLLMNLAHCLAGQVMAMGLRYAGTMDTQVRDVIFAELQGFLLGQIGSTKTAIPAVQRATGAYETCTLTCASALSLVMAGTGDLKVFTALQHLYRRTNVAYGSHMAVSMSMGLLFLGSGRLTLSNNIASVAALLMAFYPQWPSDPEDNTHHLQALRHLYGLAVVPRVMEAVDAVSQQPVSVPVCIFLRSADASGTTAPTAADSGDAAPQGTTFTAKGREICTRTPCLYPPVEMIERVEVHSPQHYPLTFDSASKELTRSASMEFRVMTKDTALSHDGSRTSRSPLESRLLDWLHRLFHQPSTTTAEALTVMDSVKLLHHVQRRLVSTAMAGDMLLNGDFSAAVKEAMEKRYNHIFLHRAESNTTVMQTPKSHAAPHHPLYQLIIENKPYGHVLESVAMHPRGTAAFPCDFTSFISTSRSASSYHAEDEVNCAEGEATAVLDLDALHRWTTEALHYYGLKQAARQHIRGVFSVISNSTAAEQTANASVSVHSASSSSSVMRLTCLLKLQASTQLPFSTLEKVWVCCFS